MQQTKFLSRARVIRDFKNPTLPVFLPTTANGRNVPNAKHFVNVNANRLDCHSIYFKLGQGRGHCPPNVRTQRPTEFVGVVRPSFGSLFDFHFNGFPLQGVERPGKVGVNCHGHVLCSVPVDGQIFKFPPHFSAPSRSVQNGNTSAKPCFPLPSVRRSKVRFWKSTRRRAKRQSALSTKRRFPAFQDRDASEVLLEAMLTVIISGERIKPGNVAWAAEDGILGDILYYIRKRHEEENEE